MKAIKICLLIISIISIFSSCVSQVPSKDDYLDVFRKLSDVNQKWLQMTSLPEAAFMMQHPPYSYHSTKYFSERVNISQILELTNRTDNTLGDADDGNKCSNDVSQIFVNLGSQWALKMLDSDGKLASGILRGGLIWPGHYGECVDAYAPKDTKGLGDFAGKYCVASWTMHLKGNYSNLPLITGICVPDSCSGKGIMTATTNILHILDRLPILKQFSSLLTLDSVTCKPRTNNLDAASIIYLSVICVFVVLVVCGSSITIWDYFKTDKCRAESTDQQISKVLQVSHESATNFSETTRKTKSNSIIESDISSSDKTAFASNIEDGIQYAKSKHKVSDSLIRKFLLCFSVFKNGEKILNTDAPEGQLLSIHGIRFLSLTWVVIGHTYIMSASMIGNRLDVIKDLDSFPFQVIMQAPFSVDSFFLLSGFLLAYLFLKEATKKDGKINWLYFYVHRFWRLTPAYMIVVFFYMLLFKYFGSGPFWDDYKGDENRGSWWWYLLYINNFIPINDMFVGWSWYLANDMQFYLISPLFLYPLWRWPKIGFSIIATFLLGSWITTGVLSYVNDIIPMFVGVTQTQDFQAYQDRMWRSFDLIYDKPYCRIAPYLIGVILGYALYKTNQKKNFLTVWQQVLGWCVAVFCSLSVVLGLYHVDMSKTTSIFYNTLCRSSFSIGLAWLIFVCETGHGGFITKLLSAKLWVPLSRLTYSAYLVHPILIHGFYQAYQTAIFFTQLVMVTNFMGFLLLSYVLAFMFSLTFESPMMNLEKLVLKRRT